MERNHAVNHNKTAVLKPDAYLMYERILKPMRLLLKPYVVVRWNIIKFDF